LISLHGERKGHFVKGYQIVDPQNFKDMSRYICNHVWSHCIWAGCYREEVAFVASFYCVLDIDDGLTYNKALEMLQGYRYMIGPTKNDGVVKVSPSGVRKPACDRFRIVLPWATPIYDLDTFKYNTKLTVGKFLADKAATDASRCWQPCKQIKYFGNGKPMEVVTEIPLEETTEFKEKKFKKSRDYYEETKRLPGYVMDIFAGRLDHGAINPILFKACCHLFNSGKSYDWVYEKLSKVAILQEHDHFETTLKSAANKTGAL